EGAHVWSVDPNDDQVGRFRMITYEHGGEIAFALTADRSLDVVGVAFKQDHIHVDHLEKFIDAIRDHQKWLRESPSNESIDTFGDYNIGDWLVYTPTGEHGRLKLYDNVARRAWVVFSANDEIHTDAFMSY